MAAASLPEGSIIAYNSVRAVTVSYGQISASDAPLPVIGGS